MADPESRSSREGLEAAPTESYASNKKRRKTVNTIIIRTMHEGVNRRWCPSQTSHIAPSLLAFVVAPYGVRERERERDTLGRVLSKLAVPATVLPTASHIL